MEKTGKNYLTVERKCDIIFKALYIVELTF